MRPIGYATRPTTADPAFIAQSCRRWHRTAAMTLGRHLQPVDVGTRRPANAAASLGRKYLASIVSGLVPADAENIVAPTGLPFKPQARMEHD